MLIKDLSNPLCNAFDLVSFLNNGIWAFCIKKVSLNSFDNAMFWIKSLRYNKTLMINLIIISFKFTPIYCIPSLCIDVSFCLSVCIFLSYHLKLIVLFSNFTLAKFYVIYTWHWLELWRIWKLKNKDLFQFSWMFIS